MFKKYIPYLRKLSKKEEKRLQHNIYVIIFKSDTPLGKLFNICLLLLILTSVLLVMLDSIPSINARYHSFLNFLEWIVAICFTAEYILRIYCLKKPWRYILSFYGIIDFLAIFPFYVGLLWPASIYLINIRILRLLRVFRIFKLPQFNRGKNVLLLGLQQSKDKIIVFLSFVMIIVVVIGSLMYIIENKHPESGFTSIPMSIYWAIVTLTTVGYGDIAPVTTLGQMIASLVMIIGYGIIAVPTGIVTIEMNKIARDRKENESIDIDNETICSNCGNNEHLLGSKYCKTCGERLKEN